LAELLIDLQVVILIFIFVSFINLAY